MIGKKVRFRAIEESDLPALASWLNDPVLSHSVVGWSFPVSLTQQREWYARSLHDQRNQRWMVDTLEGQTIGLTGLWEIDWVNRHALTAIKIGAQDVQGRGFGADAIMTLMAYAFLEVGLERLWGEMLTFNVGSYKAYVERCGWKVEGVLRRAVYRSGQFHDLIRVAALKDDFLRHPRAAEYTPAAETDRIQIQPQHYPRDSAT
jgi:RimJ/RimL family protein N-acetyltransferase